nr:helix-turn-helix transcriptional regulator [uncultured Blautia sp.]
MFPVYEEKKKNLHIHLRTSAHASPHLHNSIEFIYITEGTLELGMGQELYHMEEEMSLDRMARDLGISRFTLSRVFSGTFHRNFNQFLNEQRRNYVTIHLECSDESITDICMNAGFESQRTFNRVFRERYRMTPREYRTLYKEKYLREEQT